MRSIALAACLLLLSAGCGDQSPTSAGDGTSGAAPAVPSADEAWLTRFETGSDEVADGVAYVRFVPATGESVVTTIRQPPQDFEPNPTTLVDAAREWAVLANGASFREQRSGSLRVHSLTGAPDERVDLREVTGVDDLKPVGWAFDPVGAGLLRVLASTGRLFEIDLTAGTAEEADRVEAPRGHSLAPIFDSASGLPLLRDNRTYEPEPSADYDAGGVALLEPHRTPRSDACAGRAALRRGVLDAGGTTWVACLHDHEVRLASREDDSEEWVRVGASAPDVPRDTQSMTWVLPPL